MRLMIASVMLGLLAGPAFAAAKTDAPATPAAPSNDPGTWVTEKDYPTDALKSMSEGVVAIKLALSKSGKIDSCTVAASSGTQSLDDATCRLVKKRATFSPARDASGQPMAADWSSRIHWQIPTPDGVVKVVISHDGPSGAARCTGWKDATPRPLPDDACASLVEERAKQGGKKGDGVIFVRLAGDSATPAAAPVATPTPSN